MGEAKRKTLLGLRTLKPPCDRVCALRAWKKKEKAPSEGVALVTFYVACCGNGAEKERDECHRLKGTEKIHFVTL